MQEKELGYYFIIIISIFKVEFEVSSQSIKLYMD